MGDERIIAEAAAAFDDFIYPRVVGGGDDANVLRAFEKMYNERKSVAGSASLGGFLKDSSLSLMFAGRDTTSACLTWLFWLVAQDPLSERKILEELEAELGLNKKWRFDILYSLCPNKYETFAFRHRILCNVIL